MRLIAPVAIAVALAAAWAHAAEPVRIGLTLSQTGTYAPMGAMQRRGYELWQREVNARGGLLGRPVELVLHDDRSKPEAARALYAELIDAHRVDLVFGPYSSALTEAAAEVAEARHYPMLAAGASAESLWERGHRYLFGVYTTTDRYAVGFLELLVGAGIDRVGIVSADDSFSVGVADGAERWAARFGVKVTRVPPFPKGQTDLTAPLATARAGGARALLVCGHFDEAVNGVRALEKLGWRPEAYFSPVGPALREYGQRLGAAAEGAFSTSQWVNHERLPLPGSAAFHRAFAATYGEPPSYHAAAAYAAGQILEAAVARAGSLERETLRDTLGALNATSILGRYGVDPTGRQVRHFVLTLQWQGGKQEVTWPDELRTAPPRFPPAPAR